MSNPPTSQASRIFARFGGVSALQKAIEAATGRKRDISAIYRWNLPRAKGGTGGIVPTSAVADVRRAARLEGIVIPAEDWTP